MEYSELKEIIKGNYNNEYNAVPSGFKRFKVRIPGIVKGDFNIVTGNAGIGKFAYICNYYILNPLETIKEINDPNRLDLKVYLVLLKQSEKEFKLKLLSRLLKIKWNKTLSSRQLLSLMDKDKRGLTEDLIDKLDELDEWFEFFKTKVVIVTKRKAHDIWKIIDKDIEQLGNFKHEGIDSIGETKKIWQYYNPNLFTTVVIDDITRLEVEPNRETRTPMDLTSTISFLCEKLQILQKTKDVCINIIQPQAADKERVEQDYSGRTKEDKLQPSLDGLANNKSTHKFATLVVGLFSPFSYTIHEHAGYNIGEYLQDNYLSINILKSSYMKRNIRLGLWVNLATMEFEELPKTIEKDEYSDYVKARRNVL